MRTHLTEKEKKCIFKVLQWELQKIDTDVAQMISRAVFDVKATLFVQNRTTYLIY